MGQTHIQARLIFVQLLGYRHFICNRAWGQGSKSLLYLINTTMLAHHPVTGQPIKILRSETQISTDNKTLAWIRDGFVPSTRWNRWFSVCTEPNALSALCGGAPAALIVRGDVALWADVLRALFPSENTCETLVLCNSATSDAIQALEGVQCERILLLEDLYDSYPYLGEPVADSDPNEKIIICVAHILRMNRVAWTSDVDRTAMQFGVGVQYDAWSRTCDGRLLQINGADDACIPRTWLFQQYFKHPTHRRQREIQSCLEKNLASEYIDHIVLLNEETYNDLPINPKLQTKLIGHRLTFADVLLTARSIVPSGDYVLFANSDMWFHKSLVHLWRVRLAERRLFLALLRWEDGVQPTLFGPRSDSQDSWICARDCLDFDISMDEFGFPFGKPGCDNAITLLMLRKKFLVVNPAYSIKTMHMHASNIRNYDPKDVLYRPFYLYVDPTAIQPCAVVQNLQDMARPPKDVLTAWATQTTYKSFVRPLCGVQEEDVKTMCSMLRHHCGPYNYLPNEQNMWAPANMEQPLYNFRGGVFVTADGLVSDFQRIYVGKHSEWVRGWEHSQQSSLSASIHVPAMIVAPMQAEACTRLSSWVLHYLPRALAIRAIVDGAPDFLVPSLGDVGSFLNDCEWSEKNITVVPIVDGMNYYTENAWVVPPMAETRVTMEDVERLRKLLSPSQSVSAEGPVAVFFVDDATDAVCTRGWAEETAEHIFPEGWLIRYVSNNDLPSVRRRALADASWVIGSGNALEWIWMAPARATVIEFMNEAEPRGDIVHLAAACGQRHVVGLLKHREPVVNQRQNALMDVGRAVKKFGFKEIVEIKRKKGVEKPRIIIPSEQTGIWLHAGDTFREMAELWGKRGYVEIEHSPHTSHCWWGGIGEVLLYDRPTPRWLADELSYQIALFGNPAPPGPGKLALRQSVWGFWPRSPVKVETIAVMGHNLRGYSSRSIKSLFLGKVENGVQHAHRTGVDWSTSVELFSMPIDSMGKPYPYSQDEYLEKLCNARYGLCLPGFGPKCNREIEYFACGVVPIVTKGVDMKNYLVPPREGIHYFVAESPADVKRIVETTSPVKWALMSAACREWWRSYASVEGMFRLTWARIEQCRPFFDVGIPKDFACM
jgi:hypothetical protein